MGSKQAYRQGVVPASAPGFYLFIYFYDNLVERFIIMSKPAALGRLLRNMQEHPLRCFSGSPLLVDVHAKMTTSCSSVYIISMVKPTQWAASLDTGCGFIPLNTASLAVSSLRAANPRCNKFLTLILRTQTYSSLIREDPLLHLASSPPPPSHSAAALTGGLSCEEPYHFPCRKEDLLVAPPFQR